MSQMTRLTISIISHLSFSGCDFSVWLFRGIRDGTGGPHQPGSECAHAVPRVLPLQDVVRIIWLWNEELQLTGRLLIWILVMYLVQTANILGQNVLMPCPGFSLYKTLCRSYGFETRSYNLLVGCWFEFWLYVLGPNCICTYAVPRLLPLQDVVRILRLGNKETRSYNLLEGWSCTWSKLQRLDISAMYYSFLQQTDDPFWRQWWPLESVTLE